MYICYFYGHGPCDCSIPELSLLSYASDRAAWRCQCRQIIDCDPIYYWAVWHRNQEYRGGCIRYEDRWNRWWIRQVSDLGYCRTRFLQGVFLVHTHILLLAHTHTRTHKYPHAHTHILRSERFRSLAKMYYQGTKAAICVFDTTVQVSRKSIMLFLNTTVCARAPFFTIHTGNAGVFWRCQELD